MKKNLLVAWIIFFVSMPFMAFSQSRQITGTVTDENSVPLAAVSVLEKGKNNGNTTND